MEWVGRLAWLRATPTYEVTTPTNIRTAKVVHNQFYIVGELGHSLWRNTYMSGTLRSLSRTKILTPLTDAHSSGWFLEWMSELVLKGTTFGPASMVHFALAPDRAMPIDLYLIRYHHKWHMPWKPFTESVGLPETWYFFLEASSSLSCKEAVSSNDG